MTDLGYDTTTMEMVIKNGDFVLSTSLSEQNGALFLYTKNCNLAFPMVGVGIGEETMNSGTNKLSIELNRWQTQVKGDGAKSASWKQDLDDKGNLIFKTDCDYE